MNKMTFENQTRYFDITSVKLEDITGVNIKMTGEWAQHCGHGYNVSYTATLPDLETDLEAYMNNARMRFLMPVLYAVNTMAKLNKTPSPEGLFEMMMEIGANETMFPIPCQVNVMASFWYAFIHMSNYSQAEIDNGVKYIGKRFEGLDRFVLENREYIMSHKADAEKAIAQMEANASTKH